jgi:hypothetical protein
LGPGVYPKAEAPLPPFHPHCYCLQRPILSIPPGQKVEAKPNAARAFLQSLPAAEARQVMGGRERLRRVLEDGDGVETVVNTNVDPLYHARRMGDMLTSATATQAGATVSNAYEVAKAGGKHKDWYKQQRDLGDRQLRKGVRSLEKQIEDHKAWLSNPQNKVENWADRDPRYREGLIKKWQQDIARHKEQITILKGVLKEKGYGE